MKTFLLITLALISVSSVLSQTPSASPTPSPPDKTERPKLKNFGSSLKKYEKKKKDNSAKDLPDESEDAETIRVKTDLVINDVLVVNEKGNIINGLKSSDFIVTEDNQAQAIEVFTQGENASAPRSIVLIIDRSGSLYPYLKNSFDAVSILIDKLGANDRMAIVTDDVKLLVPFTSDKVLLKKIIEKQKKHFLNKGDGLSHQYSALLAVLNEMFDDEDVRPIVILQSDGDEITYLRPAPTDFPTSQRTRIFLLGLERGRAFSYPELLATVRRSRATIYSIIPGVRLLGFSESEQFERAGTIIKDWQFYLRGKKNFNLNELPNGVQEDTREVFLARQKSMFEIANLSGGYTDYIEKPEDAETAYSTLFTVIGNRYTIGYYSNNQLNDGKRRNVKIEVRGHPGYTVTGRKSYYIQ